MPVQRIDGKPFAFRGHEAAWTLVALPGPDCAERCLRELDLVHRAQITLDKQADMVRLVYLGAPPQGAAAEGFDKVWTLATTPSTPSTTSLAGANRACDSESPPVGDSGRVNYVIAFEAIADCTIECHYAIEVGRRATG